MPRFRRVVRPGFLIHIITRFLNHQYLLSLPEERAEYLRRAARAFGASDWRVLAYALMGTHTHFASVAGETPFAEISRPIHTGFAGWLNRRCGRLGPVVAARPNTYEISMSGAARLIAYVHNNPVAAAAASSAADSDWTSHRYYVGAAPPPSWLHVDEGLRLAGFDPTPAGRRNFDYMVSAAALGPRPRFCVGNADAAAAREAARTLVGSSSELASPRLDDSGQFASAEVWALVSTLPPNLDLAAALELIARAEAVPLSILQSPSRQRGVTRVRKIAVSCLHGCLGAPLHVVAANLGISAQAAHQLEASATEDHRATARRLAQSILKT